MLTSLVSPVETLDQLAAILQLLHTITDTQCIVDQLYLPVEQLYTLLRYVRVGVLLTALISTLYCHVTYAPPPREYDRHLPRTEVQQVDTLRDDWLTLTQLAEDTRQRLLGEQRTLWEREVDKKVKAFVVMTIQFRNSFDTEGPLVPGLTPNEAVVRLGETSVHATNFFYS